LETGTAGRILSDPGFGAPGTVFFIFSGPGRVRGFVMATKKKTAVELIALQCTECKRKNYTTQKNRRNTQEKLELNKYCPFDRKHTLHKETKVK
jgi:large subunit ribosomal protein L33